MCKITQTVLACCQLLVGGRGIRFISLFEGPDWPLVGAQWDSGAPGWSGGNVKETRREPPSGFSLLNQESSLVNQGSQPPSSCSTLPYIKGLSCKIQANTFLFINIFLAVYDPHLRSASWIVCVYSEATRLWPMGILGPHKHTHGPKSEQAAVWVIRGVHL